MPSTATAFAKRLRRHVGGRQRDYFAVAAPPFEAICEKELIETVPGAANPTAEPGGVTFAGRLADCLAANLHLRTATRVLMRIDAFNATNVRLLEKKTAAIAWELFLPAGSIPAIQVSSQRSRLYHSAAILEAIQSGMTARWADASALPAATATQTLSVRIVADKVTLSLDSSGEPLYKRGFKSGPARAPIRETLAAGILLAAGYDPSRPLVDPMCGSGTFSLEAAMLAKRMAPGGRRRFAFMDWPAFNDNAWAFLKRRAAERIATLDQPRIFASDLDADACRRLGRTMAVNHLSDAAAVSQNDMFACRGGDYEGGPGLVIVNPPYGIRIGSTRQAETLFRDICRHLQHHFNGWRTALVLPRQALCRWLPFRPVRMPLFHGGLKLTLAIGTIGA